MTLTGQSFDLDPKTFTLSNMFSMQLHKYKEEIAKVTSCALKELTIESEIKKLADTWQEQHFDLHKYHSVSWGQAWGRSALLPRSHAPTTTACHSIVHTLQAC
jgi:dynein heavy chain